MLLALELRQPLLGQPDDRLQRRPGLPVSSRQAPPPGPKCASAEDQVEGEPKNSQPHEHADHGGRGPPYCGLPPRRMQTDPNDHRQPSAEHEKVEEIKRVCHGEPSQAAGAPPRARSESLGRVPAGSRLVAGGSAPSGICPSTPAASGPRGALGRQRTGAHGRLPRPNVRLPGGLGA